MRVLCLHPAASSALQISREYHKLEERLWEKHGIELVFVDGPLLDVQVGNAVGERGGGINAIDPIKSGGDDGEERVSRRWYVEESSARRTSLPPSNENSAAATQSSSDSVRYSGLDASLLHLTQIWSRGGANISNNSLMGDCLPFQGVMGIGQGADVAGLLPLLNYHQDVDGSDSDDEKENAEDNIIGSKQTMFQGLQFVILIDGKDILSQREKEYDNDREEHDSDIYVGPEGIQSLHIIVDDENDNNDDARRRKSSEQLAKQYGPNAEIHYCIQRPKEECTPALSNIIGKFLVSQKNMLHSNPKSRELISLQNQLSNVEQLATLAITQEIQRNPPKALMAVIGPAATMMPDAAAENKADKEKEEEGTKHEHIGGEEGVKVVDKAVGAWHGARRRGFGEEGGGAPCPGEFLLREEER